VVPLASKRSTSTGNRVRGEIRVEGLLRLAPDTLYEDDVHAAGGLVARPGSIVAGDVYTDGAIQLAPTARIGGRVRPTQAGSASPSPGRLMRLMALAGSNRLDEARLRAAIEDLSTSLLDDRPQAWSADQVREGLFARGLGRLAPVTIEEQPEGGFLLRVRPQPEGDLDGEAFLRLARGLAGTARPGTDLRVLSSPDTVGQVVVLVEP